MPKILIRVPGTFRVSRISQVFGMTRKSRILTKSRVFRVSRLVITVSTYKYEPLLDETSIRVLTLDPGKDCDPLTGTIKVIRLHNLDSTSGSTYNASLSANEVIRWTPDIPYEAISYVWGADVKNHIVLLNGKPHQITANLSDALYQCRQTDEFRVLWADSICIDQDQLEEKNHQVYMMGHIYASSQRTLICLGTDPDNRDHARDALGVISNANRMIQEEFKRQGFSWKLNSFPQPLPEDPLVNDSRWQSVDILLRLPWFQRGWVVQEAALGREARAIWADCKITLIDVFRAQIWYNTRAQRAIRSDLVAGSTSLLFLQTLFHQRKAEARVFGPSKTLDHSLETLWALEQARKLDLSDPRDKIYAFMALPFVKNPMPALRPNYEQPCFEVYREFALKYLDNTSDLNILSHVTHEEVNGESIHGTCGSCWVPQWDRRAWNTPSPSFDMNFGQPSAEPAEFKIIHGEDDGSTTLQVRVVMFDSIKLISKRIEDSMTMEDLMGLWSLWSKQTGSTVASRKVEPSPDNNSLAFLCALTNGYFSGANLENWAEMLKSYSRFLQESKQQDPFSPGSAQMSRDIQFCHQELMGIADDSHLFLLERGYYGLGSWAIKQGDFCAFIFGVQTPIILRKVPDAGVCHYKVIGPAFVVSKHLNELGILQRLNRKKIWVNWVKLCGFEGWADWGLKEETIILL